MAELALLCAALLCATLLCTTLSAESTGLSLDANEAGIAKTGERTVSLGIKETRRLANWLVSPEPL